MKNTNHSTSGFTLTELLVVIGIVGILGNLLLSGIAAAKRKAYRAGCINNLGQIGKAMISFGHDHEDRLPWQLLPSERKAYFGSQYAANPSTIFGISPMKLEIQNARILHSPCDTRDRGVSDKACRNWSQHSTESARLIPSQAISYDLVRGADLIRPMTVLGVTGNISTYEMMAASWLGSEDCNKYETAFTELSRGQGSMLLAEGSVQRSTNGDLGLHGVAVKEHNSGVAEGHLDSKTKYWVSNTGLLRAPDYTVREVRHNGFTIKGTQTYCEVMGSCMDIIEGNTPELFRIGDKEVTSINQIIGATRGAYIVLARANSSIFSAWEEDKIPNHEGWRMVYKQAMGCLIHEIQHADFEGDGSELACFWAIWQYGRKTGLTREATEAHKRFAIAMGYSQESWDNRYNKKK